VGDAQALPIETVLHHHAHAAACLAENGWPLDGGDVIALTLDGIGMGDNGALWGGECLRVNYRDCEHLGGLPAVALPGGDLAAGSRGAIYSPTAWRLCRTGSSYPETHAVQAQNWPLLATAISAASTRRWHRPADGCLMRSPARWICRKAGL
jgi:hydrogenase maturation protein HypF